MPVVSIRQGSQAAAWSRRYAALADEVTLGVGNLAGRGVYAARDFATGEVVLTYQLFFDALVQLAEGHAWTPSAA